MERCESERKRSFIRCETLRGCSGYVIEEKGKSSPSPHSLEKETENFFGSLDFKLSLFLSITSKMMFYQVHGKPHWPYVSLASCLPFLLFLLYFFIFFILIHLLELKFMIHHQIRLG